MIYLHEELAPVLDQEDLFGAQRGYSSVPEQEVPVGAQRGLNPVPEQIDISIGAQRGRSSVPEQGELSGARRGLNPVPEQTDPVGAQRGLNPVLVQDEASSNIDLISGGGSNSFVVGDFSDDILTHGTPDEVVSLSAVDDGININNGFSSVDGAISIYSVEYIGGLAMTTNGTPYHFLPGLVDPNSLVFGVSVPYSVGIG
ncbi:hypothetical protein H6F95_10525 [Cyanobacteria bacterium FACHB-471]|nr:hypothetical protein [Cyanobacteria bacterium FACHB-471]